jgi:hypothetical protein
MSVAPIHLSCSLCTFSASESCMWGNFEYELSDGTRIPLLRSLGWCHDCKSATPIEQLTPIKKELTDVLGRPRNSAFELKLELDRAKSRLRNIFGFGKAAIDRLTSDLEYTIKEEHENTLYNNLIESRLGSPRCLICSKRDVLSLRLPSISEGAPAKTTGFIHPECGGELLAENSGFRISKTFRSVRIYDPEGVFLREKSLW